LLGPSHLKGRAGAASRDRRILVRYIGPLIAVNLATGSVFTVDGGLSIRLLKIDDQEIEKKTRYDRPPAQRVARARRPKSSKYRPMRLAARLPGPEDIKGWDSTAHMRLMARIEEAFSVSLDIEGNCRDGHYSGPSSTRINAKIGKS